MTPTKTAICKVFHDANSIRVTSPTGKQVILQKPALRNASFALYHVLTRHGLGVEQDVPLTYPQIEGLRRVCGTIEERDSEREYDAEIARRDRQDAESAVIAKVKRDTIVTTACRTESRAKGFGTNGAEINVSRLQNAIQTVSGKMSMLIYDIPTVKNEVCPNPSNKLWHYGFRLQLSCWVLPEKGLNSAEVQDLITHWKENGIETHVIPYAEEALVQLRAICREKLRAEVCRIHTSLIERISNAAERLEATRKEFDEAQKRGEEVTATQHERAEYLLAATYRGTLNMAENALTASIDCARMFDETENVSDLLNGLRAAIDSERQALKIFWENRTRS